MGPPRGPLTDESSSPVNPQQPEIAGERQEPRLGVATVARQLGVAPSTLRTWDRRYGIGPTGHVPGGHRRYTPSDIVCLRVMAQALTRGATPADAAHHALSTRDSCPGLPAGRPDDVADDSAQEIADRHPDLAARRGLMVAPDAGRDRSRTGGGLRLPGAGSRARGLGRAALALDAAATRDALHASIAASGVQACWDDVVRPVLSAVAQRWADTGAGIEVEHLLSECVIGVFTAAAAAGPARNIRPVLLAGMPGEHHTLPMAVLSAALAHQEIGCRSLGADLPAASLVAAMRRTGPVAVVLWSQLSPTADADLLRSLPRLRPAARIFVAGPGWAGADLPPRVTPLDALAEAVRAIRAAASPGAGR